MEVKTEERQSVEKTGERSCFKSQCKEKPSKGKEKWTLLVRKRLSVNNCLGLWDAVSHLVYGRWLIRYVWNNLPATCHQSARFMNVVTIQNCPSNLHVLM